MNSKDIKTYIENLDGKPDCVKTALLFITFTTLFNKVEYDAFLGNDGEIQVCFNTSGFQLIVTVESRDDIYISVWKLEPIAQISYYVQLDFSKAIKKVDAFFELFG